MCVLCHGVSSYHFPIFLLKHIHIEMWKISSIPFSNEMKINSLKGHLCVWFQEDNIKIIWENIVYITLPVILWRSLFGEMITSWPVCNEPTGVDCRSKEILQVQFFVWRIVIRFMRCCCGGYIIGSAIVVSHLGSAH